MCAIAIAHRSATAITASLRFLRQIDCGNDQLWIRAAAPCTSLFIADDKHAVCVEFFGLTAADSF